MTLSFEIYFNVYGYNCQCSYINITHLFKNSRGEYRQAALALGASKQVCNAENIVPLAKKGLLGAMILSFGRAAGETMAILDLQRRKFSLKILKEFILENSKI